MQKKTQTNKNTTPHKQKNTAKKSQTKLALTQHQAMYASILNGKSQIKMKVWQYCSKKFDHKIQQNRTWFLINNNKKILLKHSACILLLSKFFIIYAVACIFLTLEVENIFDFFFFLIIFYILRKLQAKTNEIFLLLSLL